MNPKKQVVTAAVFKQYEPVSAGKDKDGITIYKASVKHIADVSGTYEECWDKAREVCDLPILEFPSAMYKGMRHE